MAPRKFVLIHKRSPGDVVCLTALVRDLALTYPDFSVDVDTSCGDLWRHNPHLTPLRKSKNTREITFLKMQYGLGLREQNRETIHFCAYFHRDFKKQTGIDVPMTLPYGDLHLSQEEKLPMVEGRYWVVISGGKSDFTAKVWDTVKFQAVVDGLRDLGLGVVQIGGNDKGHWHPPLEGALNLVGQTNLRDMLRLINGAEGILCGVTAGMHVAAALQRPCVVLAGGREAWWWEAYCPENIGLGGKHVAKKLKVPHRFLHTIGLLECCKHVGCWRNKVSSLNGDPSICKMPVHLPNQILPKCMDLISTEAVLTACRSYYYDGTLPPPPDTPLANEVQSLRVWSAHAT